MEFPKAFAITNDVWMVPCRIAPSKRLFKPINRPLEQFEVPDSKKTRNTWSEVEDSILKEIINSKGERSWACIAKEINIKLYKSFPVRSGKQCRERWFNQLNPLLNKSPFSQEEDELLMQNQKILGNKWSQIALMFPGRTENQMKNRWKILKKKVFCDPSKPERIVIENQIMIKEYKNEKICELNVEGSPYSLDDIDNSFDIDGNERDLSSSNFFNIGDISPVFRPDAKGNLVCGGFSGCMKVEGIDKKIELSGIEDFYSENGENFEWDDKNEVFNA